MSLLKPNEELETVYDDVRAGDVVDPSGRGMVGGYNATRHAAHPIVRWKDVLLTCDVYQHVGEPMEVHLYCPKCAQHNGAKHMLRITQGKKKVEYDPKELVHLGGRLNVERFTCGFTPVGQSFGFNINKCGWSVEIANNIAR